MAVAAMAYGLGAVEAALAEDAQMRRRPRAALDGGRAACVVLGLPRRVCCGRGGAFPIGFARLHVTEITPSRATGFLRRVRRRRDRSGLERTRLGVLRR